MQHLLKFYYNTKVIISDHIFFRIILLSIHEFHKHPAAAQLLVEQQACVRGQYTGSQLAQQLGSVCILFIRLPSFE